MGLLHNRKTGAIKSGLGFPYQRIMGNGTPCFGALGSGSEDQLFALDTARARMKAEVNRTCGDSRAWGHYLGLVWFDMVHVFSWPIGRPALTLSLPSHKQFACNVICIAKQLWYEQKKVLENDDFAEEKRRAQTFAPAGKTGRAAQRPAGRAPTFLFLFLPSNQPAAPASGPPSSLGAASKPRQKNFSQSRGRDRFPGTPPAFMGLLFFRLDLFRLHKAVDF